MHLHSYMNNVANYALLRHKIVSVKIHGCKFLTNIMSDHNNHNNDKIHTSDHYSQ